MSSKKSVFRRKRFLIKRGLQFRYIGMIFALAVLASIVTGYTVFATGWTLLGAKLASVYPQGRLIYVFKAANIALIKNLLLISPLIFILGVLFSHKIAGPVYRIEKSLYEISKGNLALKIKLRSGDELWDMANIINDMTEALSKTITLDKELASQLTKDLDEIKKAISIQPVDTSRVQTALADLETKISELNSSLSKWSTSTS
ncbi:MAG: methyl-accepting chemotaxis protein [Candidatus Omnitrophica bacterium]|nr:methyl-accepting chemotaxis protein [Candidatus Omnitrophota bacterium]